MSNAEKPSRPEPELVILPRPQISVTLTEYDEIEIATARIGDGFDSVEHETVIIPIGDAREVAEAILALAEKRGA